MVMVVVVVMYGGAKYGQGGREDYFVCLCLRLPPSRAVHVVVVVDVDVLRRSNQSDKLSMRGDTRLKDTTEEKKDNNNNIDIDEDVTVFECLQAMVISFLPRWQSAIPASDDNRSITIANRSRPFLFYLFSFEA